VFSKQDKEKNERGSSKKSKEKSQKVEKRISEKPRTGRTARAYHPLSNKKNRKVGMVWSIGGGGEVKKRTP